MSPAPAAPPIRTPDPRVEVAWSSALCSDDYEFPGVPDGRLRSSFAQCSEIVRRADALGFQDILMPSGWACGQETLLVSAATARETRQIHHLVATREAAQRLLSRLDEEKARRSRRARRLRRARACCGRMRCARNRTSYIEEHVWSGIGRARSGCASAIVRDPDQVLAKLQRYIAMGMRAFILSGYPHLEECELFACYALPRLRTCKFSEAQRRKLPAEPATPLTTAPRV